VAERKAFLLRIDPAVLDAIGRWAADDLRSLNGQIEWILRQALKQAGRSAPPGSAPGAAPRQSGAEATPSLRRTGDRDPPDSDL
jgi:hypothetical protein